MTTRIIVHSKIDTDRGLPNSDSPKYKFFYRKLLEFRNSKHPIFKTIIEKLISDVTIINKNPDFDHFILKLLVRDVFELKMAFDWTLDIEKQIKNIQNVYQKERIKDIRTHLHNVVEKTFNLFLDEIELNPDNLEFHHRLIDYFDPIFDACSEAEMKIDQLNKENETPLNKTNAASVYEKFPLNYDEMNLVHSYITSEGTKQSDWTHNKESKDQRLKYESENPEVLGCSRIARKCHNM